MSPSPLPYKHLVPGRRYEVAAAFRDWFGKDHPRGESWVFVSHAFVPYHAGLTLVVRDDDGVERQIELQDHPDEQGAIIAALETHVVERPDA